MMKTVMNKIRSHRGESLVETLCAILIFTLASIVMYTMVSAAANINAEVKQKDAEHQTQMVAVESAEPNKKTGTAMVRFYEVTSQGGQEVVSTKPLTSITVDVYGGRNNTLFAYFTQAPAAGG